MPIITFWSNSEKTIGQTVAAAVASTVMAMEHNYKTILISADFFNKSLENCFGSQQSNKEIIKSFISGPQVNLDTGINGLLKIAQSNRVTPEIIKDYTKIIYKNRLEILYSSRNKEISIEEQLEYLKTIIFNASQYYDYVIVDLKKGTKFKQIFDILDISNEIILNTEQGTNTLEECFKIEEMQKYINSYKIIWNICKYDKNSKYNVKNIVRTVWKKQPIFYIPYNTLLFETTMEGTLAEFLLRVRTLKNEDENLQLYLEVKKLIEGILYRYQELQMKM